MEFKVSFLKPNSSILQDNVDFNFIILKDGKRVFQASNHTDRPSVLLHATNGSMTIPILNYKFNEEGPYLVKSQFMQFSIIQLDQNMHILQLVCSP
jgi:hypothetical protein